MTGMRKRVSAVFVLIAVNAAIFAYELLLRSPHKRRVSGFLRAERGGH